MINNFIDEYVEYPVILLNLTRDSMGIYLVGLYKKEDGVLANFNIKVEEQSEKIKIAADNKAKVVYRIRNYKMGSPMKEPVEIFIPENYMFK